MYRPQDPARSQTARLLMGQTSGTRWGVGERTTFLLPSHTLMLFPPCLPALVGSGQKFLPLCLQGRGGGTSLPLSIALTVLQEL